MTLYDRLGVSPSATAAEIRRAYQLRAQLLHPDRHGDSDPDITAEANRAMASLNDAWAVLSDPARRAAYDASLGIRSDDRRAEQDYQRPAGESERRRMPGPGECRLCGWAPAVHVALRSETGKVFWRTRRWTEGHLCRSCGLATFRHMTNRTLYTGWWGVISFFTNWLTIARNIGAAARLRRLPEPSGRDANVLTPATHPIDPGRPLPRRFGPYFAAMVLALFVGAALSSSQEPGDVATSRSAAASAAGGATGTTSDLTALNGRCVAIRGGRITDVVACNGNEDGRVVAVPLLASNCPLRANVYFEVSGSRRVLCVDLR